MSKTFSISGLYAITNHDDKSCDEMLSDIEATLKGGASLIQFRDKSSTKPEKTKRARQLNILCRDYNKPLIINDDLELCLEVDAQGVHLGQSDLSVNLARKNLGINKFIGVTCHNSPLLATEAEKHGANYIALGRFFPSLTKPEASLAPINCIADVRKVSSLPLVAIGGITLDNAPELIKQDIDALAVINDLFSAEHIETRAKEFSNLFNFN